MKLNEIEIEQLLANRTWHSSTVYTHTYIPIDAKTHIKNRRPNDKTKHNEGWQRGTTTAASSGSTQKHSQPTLPPSGRAHGAAL